LKHKLAMVASLLVVIGAIGAGVGALTGDLWKVPVSLGSINGQVTLNATIKSIDIEIPTGNVTVTGTKGNTLTYSGELTALHQKTQNEANQLVRSEWKIEKNGDTLKLVLEQPLSQRAGFNTSWRSPHLELNIPSTLATEIATLDGSVNIQSIDSNIKVQTSNDTITATNINGSANLQTTNGRVTLQNIAGSITAENSNGRIDASSVRGSANFHTSNGVMNLNNIGGSVTAVDSNSAIVSSSAINNTWNLRTSNGRISLSFPRGTNAKINASTSNASIGGNISWKSNASGQGTAILGTGSNQIHLQASNGSISVNYAQ
jgi:hypothetical protein